MPSSLPANAPQDRSPEEKETQRKLVILKLRKEEAYAEPKPGLLDGLLSSFSTKPTVKKIEKPAYILQPPSKTPLRLSPADRPSQQKQPSIPATYPKEPPVEQKPRGYLAAITKVVEESKKEDPLAYAPLREGEDISTPEIHVLTPPSERSRPPAAGTGKLKELSQGEEITPRGQGTSERPDDSFPAKTGSPSLPEPQEDVIITYRGPRKVSAGAAGVQKPSTEEDEFATDILKPSDLAKPDLKGGKPGMVKRRYMMSSEGKQQDVSVIASKNATEKENFDVLVADVYSELKTAQREESLRSKLSVNAPPKTPASGESPAGLSSSLSKEDLFGKPASSAGEKASPGPASDAPTGTAAAPSALFQQLRDLEQKKESRIEFVKVQAEKEMGCPTCHAKNARIIFCPYCGKGLCANCSPKVKPSADKFVYTCPNCQEEVEVKRKTPSP